MNTELIALTIKGMRRQLKNILRIMIVTAMTFAFVTGVLLVQKNMSRWQEASNKKHFGDWFVMYRANKPKENDTIKNHPYIGNVTTARTVASVSDATNSSDIMIGTMSDSFIKMGHIEPEQGRMPDNDNEAAIDRNSLIRLGQGHDIGDTITLNNKDYTLCGILGSYTNVWNDGRYLPGIIVTESEADRITTESVYIYAYAIQNYIREQDYASIADNLRQDAGLKFNFTYNSNVYDYKPWENNRADNYMYVFIMIIGIVVVTYQIVSYDKTRENVRFIQKSLGVDKVQFTIISLTENVAVLFTSAAAGFVLALGIGKTIGLIMEHQSGITFFFVGKLIIMKVSMMFLISVIISWLAVNLNNRLSLVNNMHTYDFRNVIHAETFVKTTAHRLHKSDGLWQNILVRVFSVVMALITVICTVSCVMAYREYLSRSDTPDIAAYAVDDVSTQYTMYYEYNLGTKAAGNVFLFSESDIKIPDTWEYKPCYNRSIARYYFNDVKSGNSYMLKNVRSDVEDYIKSIDGVADIKYGYYETARTFTWTDINVDNVGNGASVSNSSNSVNLDRKYIFAAEYLDTDESMYNILNDYADGKLNYESFRDGSEVIVFLDENNKGVYDESMRDGVTISLHNYSTGNQTNRNQFNYDNEYADAYEKLLKNTIEGYESDNSTEAIYNYIMENISDEQVVDIIDKYIEYKRSDGIEIYPPSLELYDAYKAGNITKEELLTQINKTWGHTTAYEWWNRQYDYYRYIVPAASSRVVKVVKVNDEIKNQLKYLIPEFGQYTVVGSTQLLQNAIDSQNELLKKYLFLDELPDYIRLQMKPNQINVKYNLGSSFSATQNVVESYLSSAGFAYTSYADEKNQLRHRTVEVLTQYGVAGIAAVIIYLLVSAVIVKSRLERYTSRLKILSDAGMERDRIVKMCMLECIREAVWFIVLMPVDLLICYVIIRKYVEKL